jgi:hypothetical protein
MAPRIGPEPPAPNLSGGEKFLHALPFGIGVRNKPRYFLDVLKMLWQTRINFPYARSILKHGVCDGCSLGPAGLSDDVADGRHNCSLRLGQLKFATMDGIVTESLAVLDSLKGADAAELRALGRIPTPLLRHRGEAGFTPTTWDEALDLIVERLKPVDPSRAAWFAGARSLSNEAAFTMREVVKGMGFANLDSSARFGYTAAMAGLADVFGAAAPTSSLKDLLGTDLLVLWGTDPSATHPVLMKYLHLAKEQGTRIAVVNPRREERLVKYWVPSLLDSAVFGTRLMDDYFEVRKGGDVAFANGVMKTLAERNGFDQEFLSQRASGQDELTRRLREFTGASSRRAAARSSRPSSASPGCTPRRARRSSSSRPGSSASAGRGGRALDRDAGGRPGHGREEALRRPAAGRERRAGRRGSRTCAGLGRPDGAPDDPRGAAGKIDFLCTLEGNLCSTLRVAPRRGPRTRAHRPRVHIGTVLDPSMILLPRTSSSSSRS